MGASFALRGVYCTTVVGSPLFSARAEVKCLAPLIATFKPIWVKRSHSFDAMIVEYNNYQPIK